MAQANEKVIGRLERRHQKLKDRVAQYEARLYLTASEQRDLAEMKKEKLATKDAMTSLRQPS
ncbi:MAG: YdcH family protein [Deltaproteobacteria bacterium]|nr:YdcH family protein [Deltaproteobacteria bacterium]